MYYTNGDTNALLFFGLPNLRRISVMFRRVYTGSNHVEQNGRYGLQRYAYQTMQTIILKAGFYLYHWDPNGNGLIHI